MNRRQFTESNARFNILLIEQYGEQPVDDYLLRSDVEQNRLFKAGMSKCDGFKKISAHQRGVAVDKYLTRINQNGSVDILFSWDKVKANLYHSIWQRKFGGKPMVIFTYNREIIYDYGHFE